MGRRGYPAEFWRRVLDLLHAERNPWVPDGWVTRVSLAESSWQDPYDLCGP